jgi:hypothetical protein
MELRPKMHLSVLTTRPFRLRREKNRAQMAAVIGCTSAGDEDVIQVYESKGKTISL